MAIVIYPSLILDSFPQLVSRASNYSSSFCIIYSLLNVFFSFLSSFELIYSSIVKLQSSGGAATDESRLAR